MKIVKHLPWARLQKICGGIRREQRQVEPAISWIIDPIKPETTVIHDDGDRALWKNYHGSGGKGIIPLLA